MTYIQPNANGAATTANTQPVNIASDQTVPVSTASLPLPAGAATSSLQTTGNTSIASVDTKTPVLGQALAAASTPVVLPAAQITSLTPLSSVTVTQATGTNLHVVVDSAPTTTVTGTVTANAGTNLNTSALALDATLTNGTAKTVLRTAAKGTTVAADTTSTPVDANTQALDVSVKGTVPVTLTSTTVTNTVATTLASTTITGSVAVTGPITDTQLRTTPVPVSGTVSTGGLTDTQLRATAVPVSLASTTVTGSVAVTGPLTDPQLRATAVPVSLASTTVTGSVAVTGPLTDTQLRASAVPVSLATDTDTTSSGTLTAAAQTVVLSMASKSAAAVIVSGTWAGTITFEGTVDGTNWNSINAVAASTSQPQPTTTVNGLYRLSPAGLSQMRANMTAFTSGSATVGMRASVGTGGIFANQILPSKITDGTNTAAIKAASTAAVATDMAVVVAISPNNTVPVSLATNTPTLQSGSTTAVTQATGTNLHVVVDSAPSTAVTGTFFQVTQPVSIAATVTTTGTLTDTQLRATAVPVSLATNTPTLQAGSTTAVTQATAANLNATIVGTGTFVTQSTLAAETTKVIGTVNLSAAQTVAVTQATGTNLHTVVDSGTLTAVTAITNALPVGTNSIGKVAIDQTTNVIAATVMQNAAVALGNGTNLNVQGYVSALISITGTMGASTAVTFEASVDDTTFVTISGHQIGLAGNLASTTTNTGDFRFNIAGYKSLRVRVSTFGTGSVTAKGYVSVLAGHSTTVNANIIGSLPVGSNVIGKVSIDQTTPGTTNAVTDTKLPASAASSDALANPTITQIGADIMVFNGTTWDRAKSVQGAADAISGVGLPAIGGYIYDGSTWSKMRGGLGDASSATGLLTPNSLLYNGSTYDRQRGMSVATTTGDTGAKTVTGNGATITNVGNKGMQLVIALGAVTGTTPTAIFKLQTSVDAGTTWVDIPGATTASLVATGNWGISVYPGQAVTVGTTTTGTTATANGVVARTWRVVWTLGGTTPSFTITSITYNYLPN